MNSDGTNQTRLTTSAAIDDLPTFSPDGTKIAFRSFRSLNNAEIYVMNADGTNPTRLTDSPETNAARRGALKPTGTRTASATPATTAC